MDPSDDDDEFDFLNRTPEEIMKQRMLLPLLFYQISRDSGMREHFKNSISGVNL